MRPFVNDNLEAAAGVKQPLAVYAHDHPDVGVLGGHLMDIEQAMGTPKGRPSGARYLRAFVEDVKASGFLAAAIKRSNQSVAVAPPAAMCVRRGFAAVRALCSTDERRREKQR